MFFNSWKEKHTLELKRLAVGAKPKEVIRNLSEAILTSFADKKLIDQYDVYQHLMTYWSNTMQDDAYLIVVDGWKAELSPVKGKKGEWDSDLVPKQLVIKRYFAAEEKAIVQLETDRHTISRQMEELEEEHGGEEGLLEEVKTDKGKISKVNLQKRMKEIKSDAEAAQEMKVLGAYLKLIEKEVDDNRKIKDAQTAFDKKVMGRYKTFIEDDVKTLVVDDKWMTAISLEVKSELERISQRLIQRIKELAERYATPMPELNKKVDELETKVNKHLGKMGFVIYYMNMNDLKIDDSVRVKNRILCPDMEDLCIGGWQGKISEITEGDDDNTTVRIEWDSITLKNMPDYYIDQSIEDGLDYSAMYLFPAEVELTQARDKEGDVEDVIEEIFKTHAWSYLGEVGKRIQKVLVDVEDDDEIAAFKAWENYLAEKLTYPFDAIITGGPDKGPLNSGDKVSVKKISHIEDFYGIFVELRRGSNKYDHPLCDLEVIEGELSNFQVVNDYSTWFANH